MRQRSDQLAVEQRRDSGPSLVWLRSRRLLRHKTRGDKRPGGRLTGGGSGHSNTSSPSGLAASIWENGLLPSGDVASPVYLTQ